eukprot:gene6835-8478_t
MPPINNPSPVDPKEYISSIESSGLPKVDYIMDKHRASTIDYVIENDPPKQINTKPRSKSLPKSISCNNCKKSCSIDRISPCDRCGNGSYCSTECKYAHWVFHKKQCRDLGMVIKMKRKTF